MFTETELREAMEHSAERADQLIAAEQRASAPSQPSEHIDLYVPVELASPAKRRPWLPLAAAAAVVAVAGGGVFLAAKPAHHSPAASRPDRAATAPGAPGAPANPSRTAVSLANLVTVPGGEYTLDARTETVTPPSGDVQVIAVPAGGFDPAKQLTGAHPVSVAGTNGYAGQALIYLIDPNDAQQASKAGRPRNTVAWPASNGTWIVLQSVMGDDPTFVDVPVATLVHDAGQLGIQTGPAPLRSGYRAGWLPAGLTLTSASGVPGRPANGLTLTAGSKSIDIQLSGAGAPMVPAGGGGPATASVQVQGYSVSVVGIGYDQATVQRVLDGLDLSRLRGPQSGWWTLAQAVD